MTESIRVSILIKAMNEEEKIPRCLAAAVCEAAAVGGEVILIDSLSTDRTVEIAKKFPVRIIQFKSIDDCCCGAATQLGYKFARGDYLYLLDGDMELQPGFISVALNYLNMNPTVAGVGGLIMDTQIRNPADRKRVEQYTSIDRIMDVNFLGGGGLYRRSAIDSVNYLANRWLKACEEAELGVRLKSKGWSLARLPAPAVIHTGHDESGLIMISRLWRNGRMRAYGKFLRNALGHPWWWASVQHSWFVFSAPAIYLGALVFSCLLISLGVAMSTPLLTSVMLFWSLSFVCLLVKKRSISDATLAVAAWHLYTIAAISGFLEKASDPGEPILAREIDNVSGGFNAEEKTL